MTIIFSEVTELMKLNWCKSNETIVMILVLSKNQIIRWKWCRQNETIVMILIFMRKSRSFDENDGEMMKLTQ